MKVIRLLCLVAMGMVLVNCSSPKNFNSPASSSPSRDNSSNNDNSGEVDDILDEIEQPQEPVIPSDRTAAIQMATTEVTKIYNEVLDREPDQPGLDFWVLQVVDEGQLISEVRRAIAGSEESIENIVELACTFFNSCNDQRLKDALENFLSINGTLVRSRDMISEMVEEEITDYYDTYLNREPDAAGLDFWINAAKTGQSKSQVVFGFLDSDEYKIRDLYLTLMKREPDAEGFEYWQERAADGMTIEQIRQSFLASSEYQIREIYRDVLKREADEPGLVYWIEQHEVNGLSIAQIRQAIENSEEAQMQN